jgi:hypothetical protein
MAGNSMEYMVGGLMKYVKLEILVMKLQRHCFEGLSWPSAGKSESEQGKRML